MDATVATTPTAMDRVREESAASRRRRRISIVIVIVVVVIAVLGLALRSVSSPAQPKYVSAPVARGTLDVRVNAVGTLQPTSVITIGSEVSGTVASVQADVNDRVSRGEVLANLDLSRLRDSAARSRAALEDAKASVEQGEATQFQARTTLRRQLEVARLSGGLTPSKTELDTAAADLARANATLHSARAKVQQAVAQLSSDLTNLSKGTIISPVDGVVLTRSIEPGQTLAAAFATPNLFLIGQDLHKMRLQIRIDEADVGLVAPGAHAVFRIDAFPGRAYPARVVRVNVASNGFGAAPDSLTRPSEGAIVYTAILDVDNPDLSLKPGMTATAQIAVRTLRNALLVPDAALRFRPKPAVQSKMSLNVGPSQDDRKAVAIGRGRRQLIYVVMEDGALRAVPVTVAASDGNFSALTDAKLGPGLRVVTGLRGSGE